MTTDADVLARLIEADPRLRKVVAEARDIGMGDWHIVDAIATLVAEECQQSYGYPPRTIVAHLMGLRAKQY